MIDAVKTFTQGSADLPVDGPQSGLAFSKVPSLANPRFVDIFDILNVSGVQFDSGPVERTQSAAPFALLRQQSPRRELWPIIQMADAVRGDTQRQAIWLLAALEGALATAEEGLPEFETTWTESGAVIIEWIHPDRRLAFRLSQDPRASSWAYVSVRPDSPAARSGPLATALISQLVKAVLG